MNNKNTFDISLELYKEFDKQYWLNNQFNSVRYGQAFYDYFNLYKSYGITKEFNHLNIYNETDVIKTLNKINKIFNFI